MYSREDERDHFHFSETIGHVPRSPEPILEPIMRPFFLKPTMNLLAVTSSDLGAPGTNLVRWRFRIHYSIVAFAALMDWETILGTHFELLFYSVRMHFKFFLSCMDCASLLGRKYFGAISCCWLILSRFGSRACETLEIDARRVAFITTPSPHARPLSGATPLSQR